MSAPLDLPPGYERIKFVSSFDELLGTRFGGGVNALCWRRVLEGDFSEVATQITSSDDIVTLDPETLQALAPSLSARGRAAVDTLVGDLGALRSAGLSPVLDCIQRYPRDEESGVVPTDVYSFHADSAPVEADTYLCSYTESSSEGLRNCDALKCVEVPETRAKLLELHGGAEGPEFEEFLRENCYDLHYCARAGARSFSFGLGNLWRIAIDYPGSPVPPCVHRAPDTVPGRPPRLLLIS